MPSYRLPPTPSNGIGPAVSLRCPICGNAGTFATIEGVTDLCYSVGRDVTVFLGQRVCPNPQCYGHVFIAYKSGPNVIEACYPPLRIDFDASDVPVPVKAAFEEALTCHANNCFVAAGMMVRKTLEALCANRGAKGDNLKERIAALQDKVVLPKELLEALQDLRLLGNDAAHIESKDYEQVGKAEVEAAIALSKEVLKAVYQYAALVQQLRALKKQP